MAEFDTVVRGGQVVDGTGVRVIGRHDTHDVAAARLTVLGVRAR